MTDTPVAHVWNSGSESPIESKITIFKSAGHPEFAFTQNYQFSWPDRGQEGPLSGLICKSVTSPGVGHSSSSGCCLCSSTKIATKVAVT